MQEKTCITKNLHRKELQKQKQSRSLCFFSKCVADMMDNLKTEFGKSFENTNDEEASRLNKEQPKQLNEFEEVVRLVKEILESGSVFPTKQREIQRIIARYEELAALKGDYMEKLKNKTSESEIDKISYSKKKKLTSN